jgi:hypothetical protein
MPLNSMQLYVQKLLDQLVIPGPPGAPSTTLEAYITPPTLEDLDGPRAYIWGARQKGIRQTGPRQQPGNPSTGGFKWIDYTMDIYLSYLTVPESPDEPTSSQEFPILIDTVLSAFWSIQQSIFVDSQGNATTSGYGSGSSQLMFIGEEWELEYPPERTPASMRMLYYTCRIGMDLREAVQA